MIFVIGGRGFVGSAIVRRCEALGLEHAVIDRASYASYVGRRCALLVNANGNSRKPLAAKEPLAEFDASVRSVRASLEDFSFDCYVHLSSCDVYPDCSSPETTREEQPLDPAAQSPYGFHKYLAEQCVRHGAGKHVIFRLGGFVGPGLKKNAIFDILHGGPLWLDPESELQFLHTGDCARIVLDLAQAGTEGTYNLCGAGVVKLADVMRERGREVPVQPGSPRVRYEVSVERVRALAEIPETRRTVFQFVRENS